MFFDKMIHLRMFCSTLSNYKGCFVVNLPDSAEVAADTEGTVGTVVEAEDGDGPKMKINNNNKS